MAGAALYGSVRWHADADLRGITMRTLFLQAPSFEGFDGGAGSRYQARREIRSFWFPTWLAQPAALVANSKLIDAPPHRIKLADIAPMARAYDLVVVHTSTPSFLADVKTIEALKSLNPRLKAGLIGAKVAVEADQSLAKAPVVDFVARNESTLRSRRSPRTVHGRTSGASATAMLMASWCTIGTARCWRTWTSCRLSRRSTNEISGSSAISSAI